MTRERFEELKKAYSHLTSEDVITEMLAEIERLRRALEKIARRCLCCDVGVDDDATCTCFDEPFNDQIAREALEWI